MSVNTSNASELTAVEVARILSGPLEAQSTFLASGPRIFDTAGPLKLPTGPAINDLSDIGTDADGFTGEGELIPEEDADFDEVTLLPSSMKSVKVITRYSNELARQSVVSLEAVLRDRMVADVAAVLDKQFYGDGGDGLTTPQGMFAWADTQPAPLTGPLTLDDILAGQALALGANVNPDKLRLFMRPGDYMALRAAKDGDQRYMLQPDAQSGTVARVLGLPVTLSAAIPVGHAAIGDMSQIAVARDLAPSVKILTERYADYDQQAIRVVARYDVKPINPGAFVTFTGITGA